MSFCVLSCCKIKPFFTRFNLGPIYSAKNAYSIYVLADLKFLGGADPQKALGQCREVQHTGIVVNVGDEAGGHGELKVKS